MSKVLTPRPLALAILAAVAANSALAANSGALPAVEVVESKSALPLDPTTATVSVVTGEELRDRGARDLRTALALVAGVEATPGGDGGPASSVPALWGLREFDAFLLLVDGVPHGGAFVPALAAVDLANVDRIEVMRGGAPVSYGATAFVGVIHVIHRAAGEGPAEVSVGVGSHGSVRAAAILPFADRGEVKQSLLLNAESVELKDDRAGWDRAHLLYRMSTPLGAGHLGLDLDYHRIDQDPNSPHPREGATLTDRVPLDANHNPSDARIDEQRTQLNLRYDQDLSLGTWHSTVSFARTTQDLTRGFLREDFVLDGVTSNADGYRQERDLTDFYLDSHILTEFDQGQFRWGLDYLYGDGEQESENFEYVVAADGRLAPSSRSRSVDERTETEDERHFFGVYGELNYALTEDWSIDAGLRINHVKETRETGEAAADGSESEGGRDSRNETRLTGSLGTRWTFWREGSDSMNVYANYRDTYKPAVIDFGPEAEPEILDYEEATSGELGLQGKHGRLDWDASVFYMDFQNLVLPTTINGSPALINAGREYYKGVELELDYALTTELALKGSWAYHEARFGNFERSFGGSIRQLRGNRQEMSPQQLGGLGLLWQPDSGLSGYVIGNFVGNRYLNSRNTALADSYTTLDAGIGWKGGPWRVNLDATNLTDRRDPVAESELGDAQYYRLPARAGWLSVGYSFGG